MTNGNRGRMFVLAAVSVVALLVFSLAPVPEEAHGPTAVSGSTSPSAPVSDGSAISGSADSSLEIAPGFSPTKDISDLGPLPASDSMSVEVGLALSDPTGLAGLVSELYAPGSPVFHHFRTPSTLAANYGPADTALKAAWGYFEKFGLRVSENPDHLLLTVSGPSARVGLAFGTSFEEYRSSGRPTFFSHPTPASLPGIAPWTGVYGLGNVTALLPSVDTSPAAGSEITPVTSCAGSGGDLVPCQVWQAYTVTPLISSGTNGSGVRIAVVDPYSSAEGQSALASDLSKFASENGFSAGAVNFVYPDRAPGDLNVSSNLDWSVEDALDLEWARASAPGATIDMTFSPNSGSGLYDAVDWLVAHQATDVITMSWGEPDVGVYNAAVTPCSVACNASTDGSYGILSPVLEFAAAEGISVFAASGDCGSADGTSGVSTNYPASDSYVTGVGGTVLNVNASGNYVSETGWSGNVTGANAPGCQNQGGSGGGYSPFPRPSWQTGLPSRPTGRGAPDVALDAATPAEIVYRGANGAVGGTSLATPIWAGVAAVADQLAGRPLGFLDPSLYAIASGPNYSRDFHDVVSGNNGYNAGPGWDPVTGWGSPRVATLAVDLAHPPTTPSSDLASFLYATPRFGPAPLSVSFRVNATGGTGVYPFEGVSFGNNNSSFAPGGSTRYTFQHPGVYSAQAYASDSVGNYSLSAPIAIVVGGGGALTVNLTASTQTPARGAPDVFSATVTGGFPPYEYNFSFGDGTYWDGSSASSASHVFGARGSFCAAVVVSDSGIPVDGGTSGRVAIGVGGSPLPNCRNDSVPLTVTPLGVGVRDAPADFPQLFSVSGGSTSAGLLPPSWRLSSTDPYVPACECTIFRSAGTYRVVGFANDSENEQATGVTNVTVAPPLIGNFGASPTFGAAPLSVTFRANASGGDGANATATVWTFGDGTTALGATVSKTYTTPGLYMAIGHLSDLGHGNASEAFVIDVHSPIHAPGGSSPLSLVAHVAPATDVSLGAVVNLTAELVTSNGSATPARFLWNLGNGSGSYRASFDWTFSSGSSLATNGSLPLLLNATATANGTTVQVRVWLPGFAAVEAAGFAPRTDALALTDQGRPPAGPAPLEWSGSATVGGPGASSLLWKFGDGSQASQPTVQHSFAVGLFSVVLTASNSWGDEATDAFPVAVTGALGLTATLSTLSGSAPLTIAFSARAVGGVGPPFQFLWSFGDGVQSGAQNVSHTFGSVGTYRIALNVTDSGRDSAQQNWTVSVAAASGVFPSVILLIVGGAAGAAAAVIAVRRRRSRTVGAVSP